MKPPVHLRPVNVGRSREFSEYLAQQTPERYAEIVAAEQRYLKAMNRSDSASCATATDFAESLRGTTHKFPISQLLDRVDAA